MIIEALPSYVYDEKASSESLLQGDVLKVDGQFRTHFEQFYPEIEFHVEGWSSFEVSIS